MRSTFRALAVSGLLGLAATQAPAQTLTMAVGAPVTSLDPHYHQLSPNNAAASMIFSRLVETDDRARSVPGLAESWRAVEPTVWEFKLRAGVRFHNGREFTAEDVAYTLARVPNVPNSPASFTVFVRPIVRVEVVDPLTIRLHTRTPYPLLPMDMTNIYILDRETHEGGSTERFNSGELAVGTGPFRVVRHANGDRIELERNDQYFGDRPAFQRVNYRMITNDAARTAALMAGDVDVIDQVPTADLSRMRNDSRLALYETTGLRLIFLWTDHSREDATPFVTDNDGRPMARNPLKDIRVRRALSMAIDRPNMVGRVMEGAATATGQFLAEGVTSHIPGYPVPRFDPDGARRLLAEAGFPQGFRITLHGPNDRYPNDARIIQAVGQMWTRIGVRTTVEALTWPTYIGRAGRAEFSSFLMGWGMNPDGSHPLRNLIACPNRDTGLGASNRGRYCNAELDRGLEESSQMLDEEARQTRLIELERMALDDVALIPLHIQTNIWAARRGFAVTPRADELTRAQDVRPASAPAAAR
ncbi:ABC transporter substrate-binding protein [Roseococcus sp. SYP-B2431]|nr:ABC transporter substrate-binding protein [Roseococcus sp. SYP-B2431]TCH98752.1 ABC transporter substrate-binding protein [Roseococcus sp. SYP-B2431]